jgi:hypothetical protein
MGDSQCPYIFIDISGTSYLAKTILKCDVLQATSFARSEMTKNII